MNIPEYIGLYHIKATFLCFSNEFWPHLHFFENFLRRKGITETCSDISQKTLLSSFIIFEVCPITLNQRILCACPHFLKCLTPGLWPLKSIQLWLS
jgi:hypothetical protein